MNIMEKRLLILCIRSISKNFMIIIRKNGNLNTNRMLRKLMQKMIQLFVMLLSVLQVLFSVNIDSIFSVPYGEYTIYMWCKCEVLTSVRASQGTQYWKC